MKTALSLVCVSVLSLLSVEAQQTGASYRSLASPPPPVTASVPVRAEAFPALVRMPADVEAVASTNRFADKLAPLLGRSLVSLASTGEETEHGASGPFDEPEVAGIVESFAIGLGKGSARAYSAYLPIYSYVSSRREGASMAESWAESATAGVAEVIRSFQFTAYQSEANNALSALRSTTLPPIYAVVTVKSSSSRRLSGIMNSCIEAASHSSAESVIINGFRGWKYSIASLLPTPEPRDTLGKIIKTSLTNRYVYQLYKVVGTSLVMVICEKPESIRLPSGTPASVLGGNKLAFADYTLRQNPLGIAYASPEMASTLAAYCKRNTNLVSSYVATVFRKLASANAEQSSFYSSAVRGVQTLTRNICSYFPDRTDKPLTLCLWQTLSGATHVRLNVDACGATYAEGNLSLATMGRAKNTLFYTETTPYTAPHSVTWPDILAHSVALYCGLEATTAEEGSGANFSARFRLSMNALKRVTATLGNSSAFVIYNVEGFPHFSYVNSFSDRNALSAAGENFAATVGPLFGQGRTYLRNRYRVSRGSRATSVTVSSPEGMNQIKPNILLTQNRIAIGTIPALNNLVLRTATGTTPFAGAVYTIRSQALVPLAGSLAASADPSAGMAVGLAAAFAGAIGDIEAADTIREGVRDFHLVMRPAPGEPISIPSFTPSEDSSDSSADTPTEDTDDSSDDTPEQDSSGEVEDDGPSTPDEIDDLDEEAADEMFSEDEWATDEWS